MIVHALAADPATPARVLVELARTTGADGALAALLLAHPNLRTADLPAPHTPAARGRDANLRADDLHDALDGPAATDATRRRVLRRVDDATLLTYLTTAREPHPAAFLETARRPPPRRPNMHAIERERALAVLPGVPNARALAALRTCLPARSSTVPGVRYVVSGQARDALLARALHYPTLLRELATTITDPTDALRDDLHAYAALAADGVDVLAHHRADALATAKTDGSALADQGNIRRAWAAHGPWAAAIFRSNDPIVASAVLDQLPSADGLESSATRLPGPPIHEEITRLIARLRGLRGTPVAFRAELLADTGVNVPTEQLATATDLRLASIAHEITYRAHANANAAHPNHPRAPELLLAGWARACTDGSLSDPDFADDAATVSYLARYALHPALPDEHRHTAIATLADQTPQRRADERSARGQLTRLALHARTWPQLHDALLRTALPDLELACQHAPETRRLLTHHLGHALRAHHDHLTPHAVRALASLAPTFPGSPYDLLEVAATLTT